MSVLFPRGLRESSQARIATRIPMTTAPTPISAILSLTLRAPNQAERRPKALIIGWSRDYLTFPYSTVLTLFKFKGSGGIGR